MQPQFPQIIFLFPSEFGFVGGGKGEVMMMMVVVGISCANVDNTAYVQSAFLGLVHIFMFQNN